MTRFAYAGLVGATTLLSCLVALPSVAEPVSMNDSALARVVGGQTETVAPLGGTSGGVIQAGDGDVSLRYTGEVSLQDRAQQEAVGLELFNSAHSNIASGINVNVESYGSGFDLPGLGAAGAGSGGGKGRNGGSVSPTNASNTDLEVEQNNLISLNSAQTAHAGSLSTYATGTATGVATSDQSSSSASVSTGAATINVLGVGVSIPVGNGFALAGDATLDVNTLSVDIGPFSFDGPSLQVDQLQGGGCYVAGGACDAARENAVQSGPAVAAASVREASGTGVNAEVIHLGNGDVSVTREASVSLTEDAQEHATALKVINAASSTVATGVNINVDRCCRVNFNGATRGITQRNVVFNQF